MAASQKTISPGMTISINHKLYRVESCVKVTVPKGTPFIKAKLRDLASDEVIEKNFKPDQVIQDVSLVERKLEYLYLEGKQYNFLDISSLDEILIPSSIIGNKVNFLKEGVEVKAAFYGEDVFSIELPPFLELMVSKIEVPKTNKNTGVKIAVLETGAKIDVPPFVEVGDVIKVDTKTEEYIQRV